MCLLTVLKKMKERHSDDVNFLIHWHYEEDDEDGIETGRNLESMTKIPFKFIATNF